MTYAEPGAFRDPSGQVFETDGRIFRTITSRALTDYTFVRDNGVLRTATWDEALDRAADGLRRAMDRNPGWGAGIFSCSKATNEMNFVAGKFARQVLRTNNIDSCNRT